MSERVDATLTNAVPVLAVRNVPDAMAFYCERLGFQHRWTWGEPPTFGCVGQGRFELFFNCQPELAESVDGLQHVFFCDDVNAMHEQHRAADVTIVSEIENKPWGAREYTVRDLSGYHLRFAGKPDYQRPATATQQLPAHIDLQLRKASKAEYIALTEAVDWNKNEATADEALAHSLFCVMAIDRRDGQSVGMVRVCGDGRYYTVWDVMVLPGYQGQKIGSAMMERAVSRLRELGPKGAFVGLFTGTPAFYERFGFVGSSGGMQMCL